VDQRDHRAGSLVFVSLAERASGFSGMGCIEGVAVYKYEADKLFNEATSNMGCDSPCSHEWSGSNDVKSVCLDGKGEYRLTYRDGAWHKTRSETTR
jgi:hypothetical protein